ncbi:MAG TPA: hypothetical protein VMW10_03735 [Alphaproteobacteria bacterium]|nr:hypothetical protein [Alphaproteobacteria bacterium]
MTEVVELSGGPKDGTTLAVQKGTPYVDFHILKVISLYNDGATKDKPIETVLAKYDRTDKMNRFGHTIFKFLGFFDKES